MQLLPQRYVESYRNRKHSYDVQVMGEDGEWLTLANVIDIVLADRLLDDLTEKDWQSRVVASGRRD